MGPGTAWPGARLARIVAGATSVLALSAPAAAQSGANVLVVINSTSPDAATELDAALKVDPNLPTRKEIQKLSQQLSAVAKPAPK